MPPLDPDVADIAPTERALTPYDEEHAVTYVRMLDADTDGADWREVSRIVRSRGHSRFGSFPRPTYVSGALIKAILKFDTKGVRRRRGSLGRAHHREHSGCRHRACLNKFLQ